MRTPKLFVREGDYMDKKVKAIVNDEDASYFTNIGEVIEGYTIRTRPQKIHKEDWNSFFSREMVKYLDQVVELTYQQERSFFFTSIRVIKFKSATSLDEAGKKLNLEKEVNKLGAEIATRILRKERYLVVIKTNRRDKGNSRQVIGDYYIKNLGLEEL